MRSKVEEVKRKRNGIRVAGKVEKLISFVLTKVKRLVMFYAFQDYYQASQYASREGEVEASDSCPNKRVKRVKSTL